MSSNIISNVSLNKISEISIYKLIYDFSCNILDNLKLIQSINLNINQYGFIIDLLPLYLRDVNIIVDDGDGDDDVKKGNVGSSNFSSTRQIILLIKDIININRKKGVCRFVNNVLSIQVPNMSQTTSINQTSSSINQTNIIGISIMTIDISLYFNFFNSTTIITKKISEFYGPKYNTYDYITKLQALITDFENLKSLCSNMLLTV
jgi:hypothetical protein